MHFDQITLKSGKKVWECVADAPVDPITGLRKQIRRRGMRQKDAKLKVELEIKKRKSGLINDKTADKVTFKAAAEHWLSIYKLSGVKEATIDVRVDSLKIINNHMASLPIRKISHMKYQQFIYILFKEKGYERNTILKIHSCANLVFKQAIKDRVIEHNPCTDVTIPKKVKTVEEIENDPITEKFMEREELEEFLYVASQNGKDNDFEMFNLLAFSGMRPGEALSIKWTDINFTTNEVRVTKTLYNKRMKKDTYKLTTTKTSKPRTFTIDEEVIAMFKKMKAEQSKMKLRYQKELQEYHDENFVFCDRLGYPLNHQQLYRHTKRILSRTSINKPITPHCFRHTHVSLLTEAEVDLPTIMDRVGHDEEKTTRKIYTHITKRMKKTATDKMKKLYESVQKNIHAKKM